MPQEPATVLTEPTTYDPVPDLVETIVGLDVISVSHWLGWAIQQIFGTDPWAWVAEQFAGDYEAAQRAGVALKKLAEFNTVYAAALTDATDQVIPYDWRGNAATGAQQYFHELARALNEQAPALNDVGRQFETMATGMYEAAQAFRGFFTMALDCAIWAAIEAAAAAATSWTVVGGIANAAAATAAVMRGGSAWIKAMDVHATAWNSAQAFTGVVAGYLGGLRGLENVPLPMTAYDHPGV
ncbi:MAG: hypothetical protein FWJ70_02490 [Micromonosporaceae bacterium]|jgi:hypothetical protein